MRKERITDQKFRAIKRELKWYVRPALVAKRNNKKKNHKSNLRQ